MSVQRMWPQGLTEVSSTKKVPLGTIRFERDKVYKYVKYDDGTANLDIVAGDVLSYLAESGHKNGFVTADVTDTDEVGAGLALATVTETDQYIWIQVKGAATMAQALTAGADGDPLTVTGAGDKTLDVSAAVTDVVVAVAADATAKEIICDFPF